MDKNYEDQPQWVINMMKAVAEEAALPPIFEGKPMEIWLDDLEPEEVNDLFKNGLYGTRSKSAKILNLNRNAEKFK